MTKKNGIGFGGILCGLALVVLGYFFPFFSSSTSHFAIIPHFMLASKKVDQFYAFLKNQRYANRDPDTIIIISPNHYHQHSSSPQTICETSDVYFKDVSYQLTPFPGVACDGEIFFPFGKSLITREHGIGEHLARIVTYFPEVEQIIPLILPTHLFPFISEEATLGGFGKSALVIASVDFSHYLPEPTALSNDQISITTLQSGTGTWSDFRALDVDCPACLFTLQQFVAPSHQRAQLRYRDSSSTILGRDMEQENTSRVFMRYQ